MPVIVQNPPKLVDVLLVDDDPADVELMKRALGKGKFLNSINVVSDGVEALEYLRGEGDYHDRPRPSLILMDLNMPRMTGHETLRAIKADAATRSIPVVVLTTSESGKDVADSYGLQASCHLVKSGDLKDFNDTLSGVKDFWMRLVQYPGDLK